MSSLRSSSGKKISFVEKKGKEKSSSKEKKAFIHKDKDAKTIKLPEDEPDKYTVLTLSEDSKKKLFELQKSKKETSGWITEEGNLGGLEEGTEELSKPIYSSVTFHTHPNGELGIFPSSDDIIGFIIYFGTLTTLIVTQEGIIVLTKSPFYDGMDYLRKYTEFKTGCKTLKEMVEELDFGNWKDVEAFVKADIDSTFDDIYYHESRKEVLERFLEFIQDSFGDEERKYFSIEFIPKNSKKDIDIYRKLY